MDRVCVGRIVGAHGIRGGVRIKSLTADPADIGRYGPVEDKGGQRRFGVKVTGEAKGLVIATLEGVRDRNAAEALKGTDLFVARDRLPPTEEDEFLYADLVGLKAEDLGGAPLGTVRAVFDFGAGEILEIALAAGGTVMVPFTKAAVPEVDVRGGRLVAVPPVYAEDREGDEEGRVGGEG